MSIQLLLDGHSFSVTFPNGNPTSKKEHGVIDVEVLSPRSMLVPTELFRTELAGDILAANGMTPLSEDVVVVSRPQNGMVAIMSIHEEAIEQVQDQLGERISFTTPLLHDPQFKDHVVWIDQRGALIYIKVYNTKLRFAEVVPIATEADLRLLIEGLAKEFAIEDYQLTLAGEHQKTLRKAIGSRFNKVVCE